MDPKVKLGEKSSQVLWAERNPETTPRAGVPRKIQQDDAKAVTRTGRKVPAWVLSHGRTKKRGDKCV